MLRWYGRTDVIFRLVLHFCCSHLSFCWFADHTFSIFFSSSSSHSSSFSSLLLLFFSSLSFVFSTPYLPLLLLPLSPPLPNFPPTTTTTTTTTITTTTTTTTTTTSLPPFSSLFSSQGDVCHVVWLMLK